MMKISIGEFSMMQMMDMVEFCLNHLPIVRKWIDKLSILFCLIGAKANIQMFSVMLSRICFARIISHLIRNRLTKYRFYFFCSTRAKISISRFSMTLIMNL